MYLKLFQKLLPSLIGAAALLPLGLALNFILNVLLARILPVEQYGLFGYIHSLVTILTIIVCFGFSNSMMRFVSTYRVQNDKFLMHGVFKFSFLLILAVTLIVVAGILIMSNVFYQNDKTWFWIAILLTPFAIDSWRQGCLRGLHKTSEAILPKQVLLPLGTILIVLVFKLDQLTLILSVYLLLLGLMEIISLYRLKSFIKPHFASPAKFQASKWLTVSIPMGLSMLARQGIMRWDIVIVGMFLGMQVTGEYTAASRTAMLTAIVLRIVNLVVGPFLAEAYHSGQYKQFSRVIVLSTLIAILLGSPVFFIIILFPEFVMKIFGEDYQGAAVLLKILVLGQFINLITGPVGLALNMADHHKANLIVICCAAVISLLGLLIFVPSYGVIAAAWVTAACSALMNFSLLIYLYFFVLRKL